MTRTVTELSSLVLQDVHDHSNIHSMGAKRITEKVDGASDYSSRIQQALFEHHRLMSTGFLNPMPLHVINQELSVPGLASTCEESNFRKKLVSILL